MKTTRNVLLALACGAVLTSGCSGDATGQSAVQRGVDKAQDCTRLVSNLADVNLDASAVRSDASAAINRLQRTVDRVQDGEVKRAANDLAQRLDRYADRLPRGESERQDALREVRSSAENLAEACDVPIDKLLPNR